MVLIIPAYPALTLTLPQLTMILTMTLAPILTLSLTMTPNHDPNPDPDQEFLSKLTGEQPSIEVVAAAFASLGPYFRLYAEYCKNYFRAIQTLQEIRGSGPRHAELRRRLGEVQGSGLRGANLDSLLIKPAQRDCGEQRPSPSGLLLAGDCPGQLPASASLRQPRPASANWPGHIALCTGLADP